MHFQQACRNGYCVQFQYQMLTSVALRNALRQPSGLSVVFFLRYSYTCQDSLAQLHLQNSTWFTLHNWPRTMLPQCLKRHHAPKCTTHTSSHLFLRGVRSTWLCSTSSSITQDLQTQSHIMRCLSGINFNLLLESNHIQISPIHTTYSTPQSPLLILMLLLNAL